ncbi:zinc metalloprotease HtpX [Thermomicrobium sp. CFH 73360]|uniref:zinc metalloprotease HtpX n=1 Tax=Thermomicrobium sp. CFH 73360 TaxID=2951987 RepID=UPI0020777D92|nr:zinc metalloprotease HtpX [Thermomicrobium sp. CFH 73360]MCM8746660.1 zinc metalloprotease HtpX [Thermomicrobium sp. CFH 73360]
MRRIERWARDPGLTARMGLVLFGLGLLYVLFLTALIASGVDVVTVLVLAVVLAFFQVVLSEPLALASVGARILKPGEQPRLQEMVERVAALAGIPRIRVGIIETPMPNAFAIGKGLRSSTVVVTRGLLDLLNDEELEAVIAHEIAHVRNRDVLVMTIAGFFVVVAQLVFRLLLWGSGGSSDRNRRGSGLAIAFIVSLLVWILGQLLLLALSRYREFVADRMAGILTGRPLTLASALLKISGQISRIPSRDLREVQEMAAFFIIPPLRGENLLALFSTHPPVSERVRRLEQLQRQLEGLA